MANLLVNIILIYSVYYVTSNHYSEAQIVNQTRRPNRFSQPNRQGSTTATKCLTPDRKNGVCINIRDCKELLAMLEQNRKNPQAIQFLRKSQCGTVGNDPKVCCNSSTSTSTTPTITKSQLPEEKYCGVPEVTQKIIGGESVQLGEYPWVAALGYRTKVKSGPSWICGGTLINSRYVLTAAHCLSGIAPWELYLVRLGDVNLDDSVPDPVAPVNVPVEKVIIHERYSSAPVTNDIALVKLRNPVQYTAYVKPICLPSAAEFRHHSLLEKQFAYVAGWGKLSFSGPFSAILQDLRLPIVNTTICAEVYSQLPKSKVDYRNLCAGYLEGGKDSCQGDSGGPLMWYNPSDSRQYQIGVVSFGYKCAEPGFPGVYTRVSEYLDWIAANTR